MGRVMLKNDKIVEKKIARWFTPAETKGKNPPNVLHSTLCYCSKTIFLLHIKSCFGRACPSSLHRDIKISVRGFIRNRAVELRKAVKSPAHFTLGYLKLNPAELFSCTIHILFTFVYAEYLKPNCKRTPAM